MSLKAHFLKRSEECSCTKEWRDLCPSYKADATDIARLAAYCRAERYVTAFKFWRNLDSFVRDYVPMRTATYIAKMAIREWERKNGKHITEKLARKPATLRHVAAVTV
jgi:hypothetical protein